MEKNITRFVIILATIGALYFGYRAISDNNSAQENPFEYNIEHFKKSDSSLHHYTEMASIKLDDNEWRGIAVDAKDQIYISGKNRLLIFAQQKLLTEYALEGTGLCLAVDTDGKIFVGMGDQIAVYSVQVSCNPRIKLEGNRPLATSLAVSDRFLYVADAGGHIVWQLDKEGNILQRIGKKDKERDIPGFVIPSPFFDVAIDPDNFLWVANPGRHSLENYSPDGGIRSSWGFYAMELEGFCGCCNPTHIAILPDGSFVTSEKGIARVKVYNRIGVLTSVVAPAAQFDEGTEGLDLAIDSMEQIYILDPKRREVRIFKKTEPEEKDV